MLCYLFLLLIASTAMCMDQEQQDKQEQEIPESISHFLAIRSDKKSLLWYINDALDGALNNNKKIFFHTEIVRYGKDTSGDDVEIELADNIGHLSRADLEHISNDNYVYLCMYKVKKLAPTSPYQTVGAICVGTKNKKRAFWWGDTVFNYTRTLHDISQRTQQNDAKKMQNSDQSN